MITISNALRQWLSWVDQAPVKVRVQRRRGRPYVYSDSVLIRCYLLMLLYPQARGYSALHRFLGQHALVRHLVGLPQLPHRTTFSRRLATLAPALCKRIWAQGMSFVLAGIVETHVLLADGTLHRAAGPEWPARYQRQGILPEHLRHVDCAAGWGKSPYHGWVWGYRTHPVVGLTAAEEPIPLLADVCPANVQDNTILLRQLPWLPAEATALVLDSSYEDQALVDAWTQRDETEPNLLTRWAVIHPKHRRGQPADWRQQLQVMRHLEEIDLYRLRSKRIEPFFAHWKEAFDLQRVPVQGPAAISYLLLALYGYQLLLWDNHRNGRPTYAYQHLRFGAD